jgi:transcriptional regulator with XRE-family HTH domain
LDTRRTWLSDLRRRSGLTQKALAESVGVSRLEVIRWENGSRNPKSGMVYGPLAAALGSEVVLRFEAEWRTRAAERMVG